MTENELFAAYCKIEAEIIPIMEFLEANKNKEEYKDLYKGFITLQSPLLFNPEILFIGINSGEGAFIENQNNGVKDTIRIFKPNEQIEFDLYKHGNARCEKKKGKWIRGYKWFERKQGINNQFAANMINVLYEIAALKYPNKKIEENQEPFWFEDFGKKVMFTNLYPIATKNIDALKKINTLLLSVEGLKPLWAKSEQKDWAVRCYFVMKTRELVKLVQPKIVVCLGLTVYNDFMFKQEKNKEITEGELFGIPVIGFSRSGNWGKLIPKIAKKIQELHKSKLNENKST